MAGLPIEFNWACASIWHQSHAGIELSPAKNGVATKPSPACSGRTRPQKTQVTQADPQHEACKNFIMFLNCRSHLSSRHVSEFCQKMLLAYQTSRDGLEETLGIETFAMKFWNVMLQWAKKTFCRVGSLNTIANPCKLVHKIPTQSRDPPQESGTWSNAVKLSGQKVTQYDFLTGMSLLLRVWSNICLIEDRGCPNGPPHLVGGKWMQTFWKSSLGVKLQLKLH